MPEPEQYGPFDSSIAFSYTSGRFLFNEEIRMRERYVRFNVRALQQAAEIAVNRKHGEVTSIKKLAEGGFNRIFLLVMQDGFEMVAKIPYRITCPQYFATASEVATLAFLRLRGIPVPEVYAYSANAENSVGTEYILMEKAPGVCASTKWQSLNDLEMKKLAHSYVEIEKSLFNLPFSSTGSLYFKSDISLELQTSLYIDGNAGDEVEPFCIGPVADYMFWYGARADLNLSRGPWRNPVDYLQSIAEKEIQWTKKYGKPMEPDFTHNALGMGIQYPETYIELLRTYQSLTPHLLPKDLAHPSNQPILRHPDPTPSNIFVSPETGRITCLIDWQHAIIQPRLLAAGYPRAFENPDHELSAQLIEPQLPRDLESLSEQDRSVAQELHRQRLLFYDYRVLNGHLNQHHIAALRDPLLVGRQLLVDRAGRQWEGNAVTLKGALVRAVQFWDHLPDVAGVECPVHFDQAELDKFAETEEGWLKMSVLVEQWHERLNNMSEEGWVRNEDYEETKEKLRELEDEVRHQCEGDEEDIEWFQSGWPFRDRDEKY